MDIIHILWLVAHTMSDGSVSLFSPYYSSHFTKEKSLMFKHSLLNGRLTILPPSSIGLAINRSLVHFYLPNIIREIPVSTNGSNLYADVPGSPLPKEASGYWLQDCSKQVTVCIRIYLLKLGTSVFSYRILIKEARWSRYYLSLSNVLLIITHRDPMWSVPFGFIAHKASVLSIVI